MSVTYYRSTRPGPEAALESAVADSIPDLFDLGLQKSWTAASLPVGAGMPDLSVVTFEPDVLALAEIDRPDPRLLGYLRGVGRVRAETVARESGRTVREIVSTLEAMIDARIVDDIGNTYSLRPLWRRILPEVVTIEAKVDKWQVAVNQAARNGIFSHRTYVALPCRLAARVCRHPLLVRHGVGVIGVDGQQVHELRPSRRRQPRVWPYYYHIACKLAYYYSGDWNVRSLD